MMIEALLMLNTVILLVFLICLSLIFVRFHSIINIMSNVENVFDVVDTPKEAVDNSQKRELLKQLLEQGKIFPGKKPWTIERLNKTSNKVINNLYESIIKPESNPIDILSKLAGVDNFQTMMNDINSSYLVRRQLLSSLEM